MIEKVLIKTRKDTDILQLLAKDADGIERMKAKLKEIVATISNGYTPEQNALYIDEVVSTYSEAVVTTDGGDLF